MKIKLLYIGKENSENLQDAIQQYQEKLKFYTSFEMIAIPYLKNTKSLSIEEQKKKEGELILKKIETNDYVILMDEYGKEFTSIGFSELIQQQLNSGIKTLIFVIGGAYGFSQDVFARAQRKISLSKMTFPHLLARLIFVEQLYRAFTILKKEPYHHI